MGILSREKKILSSLQKSSRWTPRHNSEVPLQITDMAEKDAVRERLREVGLSHLAKTLVDSQKEGQAGAVSVPSRHAKGLRPFLNLSKKRVSIRMGHFIRGFSPAWAWIRSGNNRRWTF